MSQILRALAADLAGSGIRVSAVCPGFLDTPMTDRTIANMGAKTGMEETAARAALGKMNRRGELVQPAEVADAIVGLLQANESGAEPLRLD